jgi:4'-phosphopantetheinyl transferase
MRFPQGRHQQLFTRALARRVLSHYLPDIAPQDWRFDIAEFGRPSIARPLSERARELQFNLAHTQGLVVMAVGRRPGLGVDVEIITRTAPLDVAHRYFSPREIEDLDALPEADKARRFQRLWTLKESYLKAVGSGIGGGLDRITFTFENGGLRFEHAEDADAAHWQFREFTIDGQYLVALAYLDRDSAQPVQVTLRDFSGQE